MRQYLDFLKYILANGKKKDDRTHVGTISTFGYQMRFDLNAGFPLLTTKKVHLKSVIYELLWFLKGDTNIRYLVEHGVRIWNEWPYQKFQASPDYKGETLSEFALKIKDDPDFALKYGDLGPVYGHQWRHFDGPDQSFSDQLKWVINEIKTNPNSRRLVVSSWNPALLKKMLLPPCHVMFQFYVRDNRLSCQFYQRSADAFLGVPFNIASYALLTMMVAQVCGLEVGELIHTIGDAHIYLNHLEQVKLQLTRTPRPLPQMRINPAVKDLFSFQYADFTLTGYNPYPAIKAEVAV